MVIIIIIIINRHCRIIVNIVIIAIIILLISIDPIIVIIIPIIVDWHFAINSELPEPSNHRGTNPCRTLGTPPTFGLCGIFVFL